MSDQLNNPLDADLQDWLDAEDVEFQKREIARRTLEKQALRAMGSWDEIKFNWRRHVYAKAIGA
jgi:hypothetical protein